MRFRLVSDITSVVHEDSIGQTRAQDGVNDNATFVFPTEFDVAVEGVNYMFTANSAGSEMVGWSKVVFPSNGTSVRVQAFYPALLMSYSSSPQTFTVKYDQCQTKNGTDNYRSSDLMYGQPQSGFSHLDGSGKVNPTEDPIPLVFEHKMAKIRIDVTSMGATVKQIKMKNVLRSIDFDTDNISFSNLASATDGLGDNVIMYDDATGTSTDFVCAALIPKQNLTAGTQFIEVVVGATPSDVTLIYTLPDAASFNPGKQYIYNLTVTMDKLNVSCSIADWDLYPAGWTNINEPITL